MRTRAPLIAAIVAGALIVVVGAVVLVTRPWEASPTAQRGTTSDADGPRPSVAPVLDPTSHLLDDAGDDAVVVVEFLDFECEACGAVYPTMEQLREDYEGEVTFAIRYFPLPGHANSVPAALAAEAAAQQGELEAMYSMLFETQLEWGEQQESQADRFRGYAEEIGLDMERFDVDVASEETLARVQLDVEAGMSLGVQSTPTIYVDGEQLQLQTLEDIEAGVEAALAAR